MERSAVVAIEVKIIKGMTEAMVREFADLAISSPRLVIAKRSEESVFLPTASPLHATADSSTASPFRNDKALWVLRRVEVRIHRDFKKHQFTPLGIRDARDINVRPAKR